MIPVTLQDSLLARLDRLTNSKVVAQIGAAIGREFSFELLAAVVQSKPKELEAALALLEAADLISARGTPPQVIYTFKHGLVQEAAYSTLLISRRQTLHKRIAETLQSSFAPDSGGAAGIVGASLHRSGSHRRRRSIGGSGPLCARRLVPTTLKRSANSTGLWRCLSKSPIDSSFRRREFELRIALIEPLYATHGYSGTEVEQNYARLLELGQDLGETRQLLRYPVGPGRRSIGAVRFSARQ